jgi:hypothetical protein
MRPTQFSILPLVVKNPLIINGLCFLANAVLADRGWFDMNEIFGLYYPGQPILNLSNWLHICLCMAA